MYIYYFPNNLRSHFGSNWNLKGVAVSPPNCSPTFIHPSTPMECKCDSCKALASANATVARSLTRASAEAVELARSSRARLTRVGAPRLGKGKAKGPGIGEAGKKPKNDGAGTRRLWIGKGDGGEVKRKDSEGAAADGAADADGKSDSEDGGDGDGSDGDSENGGDGDDSDADAGAAGKRRRSESDADIVAKAKRRRVRLCGDWGVQREE